jgi:flavodoxin
MIRAPKRIFMEILHSEWDIVMSRVLTVFYSRTGHTHTVAETVAQGLGAELEELQERRKQNLLIAGLSALFKRETELKPVAKDPAGYDLVVVGTPVWGANLPPAVRSFLHGNGSRIAKAAFFCTEGGSGGGNVFRQMGELCGKAPLATLELTEPDLKSGAHESKIAAFVETLGSGLAATGKS